MGPPIPHEIRHIRYEEFVALKSEGAGDFDGFLAAVEALLAQMGDIVAHHVLVDLRRASVPPMPETTLARALEHLRRLGLGVKNKVAVVTDPADEVRRGSSRCRRGGRGVPSDAGPQLPRLRRRA